MTIRNITPEEQIGAIEEILEWMKRGEPVPSNIIAALASVVADIRARRPGAPSVALFELTRRLTAAHRSKTRLGYDVGAMIGVGEELVGRWPIVKAALELFGAMVESGDDPFKSGFRIGFEHAVAGGEEYGRYLQRAHGPLVLYFDNEEDRREMIDAIQLAKPGMVEVKIPKRRNEK